MRFSLMAAFWMCCVASLRAVCADDARVASPPATPSDLIWLDNYRLAYKQSEQTSRRLLIWFTHSVAAGDLAADHRADDIWAPAEVRSRLADYVLVRARPETEIEQDGKPLKLAEHPAFAELYAQPGIAIVDLVDPTSPHYGHVVSIYPFARGTPIGTAELVLLLDLPPGSLSQRTMIFAVRSHPDRPQSASGEFVPLLSQEAERHSSYQASLLRQGHHHWEQRFYQLNDQLQGDLVAQEVCAESWPGQSLLDAARECVDSWRQSPGHWRAVRQPHPVFGYDMKRGHNNVWYATGLFGVRR